MIKQTAIQIQIRKLYTSHKQAHKHLTLHRNKKLNKHLTLHNIHRNTFTRTQPVGESNVNGKEKDSTEAVGLELMIISFMQSFLAKFPPAKSLSDLARGYSARKLYMKLITINSSPTASLESFSLPLTLLSPTLPFIFNKEDTPFSSESSRPPSPPPLKP